MRNISNKIINQKKQLNCKIEENFCFQKLDLSFFSYEKSGTQATEVRRMYLERKDMTGYKAYTAHKNDPYAFMR